MKYNVSAIQEYLEIIPAERKVIIQKLIDIVHEYFSALNGNMKYNLPTFEPVCSVASQKNHISVYIHRIDLVEKYREELVGWKTGKSCIRFMKPEQMPEVTIRKYSMRLRKTSLKWHKKRACKCKPL